MIFIIVNRTERVLSTLFLSRCKYDTFTAEAKFFVFSNDRHEDGKIRMRTEMEFDLICVRRKDLIVILTADERFVEKFKNLKIDDDSGLE